EDERTLSGRDEVGIGTFVLLPPDEQSRLQPRAARRTVGRPEAEGRRRPSRAPAEEAFAGRSQTVERSGQEPLRPFGRAVGAPLLPRSLASSFRLQGRRGEVEPAGLGGRPERIVE